MNTFCPYLFGTFFMLFPSCEKEPETNFGFDSEIEKNSCGMVIEAIDSHVDEIELQGFIRLREGELVINLLSGEGNAVYSQTLKAPAEIQINENFPAVSGNWKLTYNSNNGLGKINVHFSKKYKSGQLNSLSVKLTIP